MMDNWCAPQWTDFTCSPQMHSDSYFEREHEEHEPQIILKSSKYQVPQIKKSELSMDSLEEDTKSMNESGENVTPAKVAFYVPLDKEASTSNVSTIGDLPEAMKNLQICAKARKATLSSSMRQKSSVKKSINSTICGDYPSKYLKEKKEGKCEDGNVTLPKGISFGMTQSPKEIQSQAINKRLSYKIIRRRESNTFRSKRFSLGKNGPRVLTSQYRRRSIIKGRRRSNQFVSLAEAVSKFHSGTPERFRTVCSKDLKPAALSKLKRAPLKLTCPISPALRCNQRCKQRMKNAGVLTKEQREQQELEEMKKHQIKANPVPANILKAPVPLKKVERKPNTVTEEFKLTQPKTYRRTIMPLMNAKQAPIKKEEHKPTISTSTKTDSNTLSIIPEKTQTVPDKVRQAQQKQTRHTTGPLLSPNKPIEKEEHKASSSSIATTSSTSSHSRVTRTVPFAFEARTKEFLEKREQKMKTLQIQESSKAKSEFHARPVPKFSKATSAPKEHSQKKSIVPCPFSFEERDKGLAKKKEQQVKQILEERQKPRNFHANPVPTFKPVAVHGLSKDNSRIRDKSVDRTKKSTVQTNDQENQQPNIIPTNAPEPLKKEAKAESKELLCNKSMTTNHKPKMIESHQLKAKTAIELNTDKRAKDRQAFDEQLKQKELEQEMKKQEEEKARIAKEKLERAELRKKAEIKARPMPLYRPLQILKSARPPTSPKSPAWASKLKSKNVP